MKAVSDRPSRFLDIELTLGPRLLAALAALLLVAVYILPLWNMTMFAPQYPEGLRMDIYSYKLVGGNNGQDLKEINLLNHYIGMKDLAAEDFGEFKWLPFVVGGLALLCLRTAVHATMAGLVDNLALFAYFSLFSLWSFASRLYSYGHNLAPTAAVKVPPFMPPLAGFKQLANFQVYSYPAAASYALGAAGAALALALILAWRGQRQAHA